MRARLHICQPFQLTPCSDPFGATFYHDRINSPSFPRDSSSFWIWFSRKNMATVNASSASSCNLGGITTLSSPIKSSGGGFGHSILRRGNSERNSGCGDYSVAEEREHGPLFIASQERVWISCNVQILSSLQMVDSHA